MINTSPELTVPTEDFEMWYSNMTKRSPTMNPWIEEFYNHKFSCTLNDTGTNHLKKCAGKYLVNRYFIIGIGKSKLN